MGMTIHGRTNKKGERVYRVWSTNTDSYVAGPGNAEQIHEFFRNRALEDFERDFKERMARVEERNDSSVFDSAGATDPWSDGEADADAPIPGTR